MPRPSEICKDPDVKRRYPPKIKSSLRLVMDVPAARREEKRLFSQANIFGAFFFLTNTPILIKIETGCKYFTLCKSFDAKKIRGHFTSFCMLSKLKSIPVRKWQFLVIFVSNKVVEAILGKIVGVLPIGRIPSRFTVRYPAD